VKSTRSIPVRPFQLAPLILVGLAMAAPAHAENKRHHIGLAFGYEKLLSNELKDDASGIDFTNAGYGSLSYRFSIQRNIDLTLDSRATVSTDNAGGIDFTLTNSYLGPGVRLISPNEGMRPYVQANFFFVREKAEGESGGVKATASESGAGFGVSGGVDIRAGNLISIPIEANYMYGKPADDISGIGINVGLTFNFGTLNK
jgi:outer membrane protein with beta-barrel domain